MCGELYTLSQNVFSCSISLLNIKTDRTVQFAIHMVVSYQKITNKNYKKKHKQNSTKVLLKAELNAGDNHTHLLLRTPTLGDNLA